MNRYRVLKASIGLIVNKLYREYGLPRREGRSSMRARIS